MVRRALPVAGLALPAAALAQWLGPQWLATPLKAVAAAAAGLVLAGLLRTPAELLVIAGLAAVTDAASIAVGPTRLALDEAPAAFEAVALQLPPWSADGAILVGAVDLLFLVLFSCGPSRAASPWIVPAAATGALIATVAAAQAVDHALPAIPPMALALWAADAAGARAAAGRES